MEDNKKAPHFEHAKKFEGRKETDREFENYMTKFSKAIKFRFDKIRGSAYAWCGLAVFMALASVNFGTVDQAYRAKSWDNYAQEVLWRTHGFSQGDIIRINSKGDCKSAKNNHVTMANGDCTAEHLTAKYATFDGYGGNQNDSFKNSTYKVSTICAVRRPVEMGPPPKILKNKQCTSGSDSKESTR